MGETGNLSGAGGALLPFHPSTEKRLALRQGCAYFPGMTVQEIKLLPVGQKLAIMEAIWDDLRERFETVDLSPEQKALLDSRRERVKRGCWIGTQ